MQPIDSAWSVLKALSREDLEEASRTGGMARMPGTMRPEFSSGHPGHRAPMIGEMNQPPAYDEGSEMMQEYNELIHPEEEAEHHRINAPTPVRAPVMRVNRKTRERLMVPGAPMPVGEAGEASMDDPSQMEHLGAQLAHADMMRDDVAFANRVRGDELPAGFVDWLPNLQSTTNRAPNRAALSELGTYLNSNEILARQSGLTTEDIEMLRRL
jgi:hypothetical protein